MRFEAELSRQKMSDTIFISHASEDKAAIARPLAKSLRRRGYTVWFDEFSLELGDSLKRSIDKGLATAHFGVVILSPSFFQKRWPQEELDGLAAREIAEHRKLILPIWHNIDFDAVCKHSPTLAGKLAIDTTHTISEIAKRIQSAIESAKLNWVEPDNGTDKRKELHERISEGTMKELGAFAKGPDFLVLGAFDRAWEPEQLDMLKGKLSDMLESDFGLKDIDDPEVADPDDDEG